MRKNISVNMVNTRSTKEKKTKEKLPEEPNIPVKEVDLETPDHSIDGAERKTTESTHAKRRRTKKKDDRVLTNRQWRQDH